MLRSNNFKLDWKHIKSLKRYQEILHRRVIETVVGLQVEVVDFIVISDYHDMLYVKWHMKEWYQDLKNQAGKLNIL